MCNYAITFYLLKNKLFKNHCLKSLYKLVYCPLRLIKVKYLCSEIVKSFCKDFLMVVTNDLDEEFINFYAFTVKKTSKTIFQIIIFI